MIKMFTKKRKGFTLIELVVVIAILGVLAAIAIPRFVGTQTNAKLRSDQATARTIASALSLAEAEGDFIRGDDNYTYKEGLTKGISKANTYDEVIGTLIANKYLEEVKAPQSVSGTFTVEVSSGEVSITNGSGTTFYPAP